MPITKIIANRFTKLLNWVAFEKFKTILSLVNNTLT
jgi:hypothetical protein